MVGAIANVLFFIAMFDDDFFMLANSGLKVNEELGK
jgi:hypothetical protein